MKNEKYKLIASDLDWTLIYNRNEINQENLIYLKKYLEKGYPFVIITGRPLFMTIPLISSLGLINYDKLYLMCYNGALFYSCKDKKVIDIAPKISADEVKRIHNYTVNNSLNLLIYYDEKVFVNEIFDFEDKVNSLDHLPLYYDNKVIENLTSDIYKAIISTDHDIIEKHLNTLKSLFPKLDFFYSQRFYLEVMRKGINKGYAIEYIANYLNIEKDQIIAIGDSENDLFMFKKVIKSFAPENASERIKSQASEICLDVKDANFKCIIKEYFNID